MPENRYITNPETRRQIRVGGVVFCQLIYTYYDYINDTLIRKDTAPPVQPRQYFYNTQTNRRILAGSRRYHELMNAGWEIEDSYYIMPPGVITTNSDILQENFPSYEKIMDIYGERLANLNISLCRECLSAIKIEEGELCNECRDFN